MNNFSMCSFGVNTRYYVLAVGTYLSFVSQYMIQNVFSRIDVAKTALGFTRPSELWGFFFGVAFAAAICTPLIVWGIDRVGLKYMLLIGMAVTGVGLFLQSLVDSSTYYALVGYMLVNLGSIAPWASVVFLASDWFLEAQWTTVLCFWQMGRVAGHCLAYYCSYLYVGVDNSPNGDLPVDELVEKYNQLLKIYLAIAFTSLMLLIVGLKSKPQGLEVTKRKNPRAHLLKASHIDVRDTENQSRIEESRRSIREPMVPTSPEKPQKLQSLTGSPVTNLSSRGTLIINGGHTVLVQNNETSMQANRSSIATAIDIRLISTWTRIKILMLDGYFKYLVVGCMLPLAVTGFGEMFIAGNMMIFNIKQDDVFQDITMYSTFAEFIALGFFCYQGHLWMKPTRQVIILSVVLWVMFAFYSFSFYWGSNYVLLARAVFRASYSVYFVASSQLILRYYERACASVMVLGFALIVMSNYIITALSSAISVIANSGMTKKEYMQSRVFMLFIMLFAVAANLRVKRKLEDEEIQVDDTLKLVPQLVVDEDADDSDIFARPQMTPFSISNHMNDSTSALYRNGQAAPSVAPTIRIHEDSQLSMFQRTSKAVVITGM